MIRSGVNYFDMLGGRFTHLRRGAQNPVRRPVVGRWSARKVSSESLLCVLTCRSAEAFRVAALRPLPSPVTPARSVSFPCGGTAPRLGFPDLLAPCGALPSLILGTSSNREGEGRWRNWPISLDEQRVDMGRPLALNDGCYQSSS